MCQKHWLTLIEQLMTAFIVTEFPGSTFHLKDEKSKQVHNQTELVLQEAEVKETAW